MSDVSDGEIVDEAVLSGSAAASAPGQPPAGTPAAAVPYDRQPSGSPVSPQAADAFFEVDPEDPGVRLCHSLWRPLAVCDAQAAMPKASCQMLPTTSQKASRLSVCSPCCAS